MSVIDDHEADLIVLAGFMRILTAQFVNYYVNRLVNVHPSLLPKYKGLNTHRRAIEAGDSTAGATVHWAQKSWIPVVSFAKWRYLSTLTTLKIRLNKEFLKPNTFAFAVVRDLSLGVVAC